MVNKIIGIRFPRLCTPVFYLRKCFLKSEQCLLEENTREQKHESLIPVFRKDPTC